MVKGGFVNGLVFVGGGNVVMVVFCLVYRGNWIVNMVRKGNGERELRAGNI